MIYKKIKRLIPEEYRTKWYIAAAVEPIKSVLNLCGVAILVPALSLVLEEDSIFINYKTEVILATIAAIVIRSLLCLFIIKFQNRFLLSLYRYYSGKMFTNLYSKGLIFVKKSNSTELSYDINGASYNFTMSYISGLLRFFGESLFCILMVAGLLVANFKSTILVFGTLTPIVLAYLILVRKKLHNIGKAEFYKRRDQHKLVQETFKGYAEMQVNGAYNMMFKRFEQGLKEISGFSSERVAIESLPGYLMEIGIAIVASIIVLASTGTELSEMKLFLGVFAVAVMRMIPSVRTLISTYNSLRNSTYSKNIIEKECTVESARPEMPGEPLPFKDKINVENICFGYEDRTVLNNISLSIEKGDIFGIKGRTGSGKSTLFNILLGLITPDSGSISIDGVQLTAENAAAWQSRIGYVPQDVFIADVTLAENVALGCTPDQIDMLRVEQSLIAASMGDYISKLPEGLNTKIGETGSRISGGQKQRIGIARALYKGADVLFFDEATSSLDPQTETSVNESIASLNSAEDKYTMIIISHRESSLEICNKIFSLD